ncbi:MAG: glycosyltransferase [Deltaproteobacteria bacterium]|nr:glycosyltransferase [Deltaproteobacteria bacterium]
MIFVTVGTQLPFDRLVRAVDAWAGEHPGQEVVIQTASGGRPPEHCQAHETLAPEAWRALFDRADLVVAHAGIGTILSCREAGRRLIVVPREAARGEHRNDHQLATVASLGDLPGIRVITEVEDLPEAIEVALSEPATGHSRESAELERLVGCLRRFALGERDA